jgi:hypothetical protein
VDTLFPLRRTDTVILVERDCSRFPLHRISFMLYYLSALHILPLEESESYLPCYCVLTYKNAHFILPAGVYSRFRHPGTKKCLHSLLFHGSHNESANDKSSFSPLQEHNHLWNHVFYQFGPHVKILGILIDGFQCYQDCNPYRRNYFVRISIHLCCLIAPKP